MTPVAHNLQQLGKKLKTFASGQLQLRVKFASEQWRYSK